MANQRGFSLIELLIVVAIILIIAAIAIPSLLQARIAANEASAVGSIRTIKTAEYTYNGTYTTIGYAAALADLGGPTPCTPAPVSACIIDNLLATSNGGSGGKSGYVFAATGIATSGTINNAFVAGAAPLTYKLSGNRLFCSTDDGVLRSTTVGPGAPVTVVATCLAYPVAQ